MNLLCKHDLPVPPSKSTYDPNIIPQQHSLKNSHFEENNYMPFIKCIGVVRGQWLKPNGKMQSICYGSGVALSKRVVLTCAHSVYSQNKRIACNSISFIPAYLKDVPNSSNRAFKSAQQQFLQFQQLKPNQLFSKFPLEEDLALIYLSQDLDIEVFPKIGEQSQLVEDSKVLISGFPSYTYFSEPDLKNIHFKRQTLFGNVLQLSSNVIYHNLPTQTGHSGSAILAIDSSNSGTVIGVHTHKGRRNMGVFLNDELLKKLAYFQVKLGLFHQDYSMDIKFPKAIKQAVYDQLTQTQKNALKTREQYFCSMQPIDKTEKESSLSPYNFISQQTQALAALEKLLQQNQIRKKQIFGSLVSIEQVYLKWLQLQNTFLLVLQSHLNLASKKRERQLSIAINLLNQMQSKLKASNKVKQITIVKQKFPTIESHLNWNMDYFSAPFSAGVNSHRVNQFSFINQCNEYRSEVQSSQTSNLQLDLIQIGLQDGVKAGKAQKTSIQQQFDSIYQRFHQQLYI